MRVKELIDKFKSDEGRWCTLSCYVESGPGMIYEGPVPENGIIINDKDMSDYTAYDFSVFVDVDKRHAKIYIHC